MSPQCPRPTKAKFATESAALARMHEIQAISTRSRVPVTTYLCECEFYHLTGSPDCPTPGKTRFSSEKDAYAALESKEWYGCKHVTIEQCACEAWHIVQLTVKAKEVS